MNKFTVAGVAMLLWWWWDMQKGPTAAGGKEGTPLTVNASPTIVNEDTTGQAIRQLISEFQQNPDLRVAFQLKGDGLVVSYGQRPGYEFPEHTRGTDGRWDFYDP